MSHNPWPFVIVALISLSFLADATAQSSRPARANRGGASIRFGDLDAKDAETSPGSSQNAGSALGLDRAASPPRNRFSTDAAQPAGRGIQLGGIEPASSDASAADSFTEPESRFTPKRVARDEFVPYWDQIATDPTEPASERETPVETIDRDRPSRGDAPGDVLGFDSAGRNDNRPAGGRWGAFTENGGNRSRAGRRVNDIRDDRAASFGEPLFEEPETKQVILAAPPRTGVKGPFDRNRSDSVNLSFDQSPAPAATSSIPEATMNPASNSTVTASEPNQTGSDTGSSDTGSSDTGSSDTGSSDTDNKLPLWPTMALFASLAANLFFGWIAWDTHSRYQDFVEEVNEGDALRQRRSRRLRDEPSKSRRPLDSEKAQFLNGGLEV